MHFHFPYSITQVTRPALYGYTTWLRELVFTGPIDSSRDSDRIARPQAASASGSLTAAAHIPGLVPATYRSSHGLALERGGLYGVGSGPDWSLKEDFNTMLETTPCLLFYPSTHTQSENSTSCISSIYPTHKTYKEDVSRLSTPTSKTHRLYLGFDTALMSIDWQGVSLDQLVTWASLPTNFRHL
ncbi:hypothetical protein RRG08_022046 [Elysia crispata]|uniref:Uncharacterized protein n=1 Tax=Elysia crispata TaxID=231223 RepID=A0AAE0YZE4_9GAST|nr:hypothetical protein RRG08_022046 [Elysia crispata]